MKNEKNEKRRTGDVSNARHARAWLLLTLALALHVTDEALTGFLDVYNPAVRAIRSRVAWFPAPTFTFGPWLAGLIVLVMLLAALYPLVRRGAAWTRPVAWILSVIMFMNGLGHLVGSLAVGRWLAGATSAPLLLGASLLLGRRTWRLTHGAISAPASRALS